MFIADPDMESPDAASNWSDDRTSAKVVERDADLDSNEWLIVELRHEFKRRSICEAARDEDEKRKRRFVLTLVIAPVGLLLLAALIERVLNRRTQIPRR
jgi:hypothetical protein